MTLTALLDQYGTWQLNVVAVTTCCKQKVKGLGLKKELQGLKNMARFKNLNSIQHLVSHKFLSQFLKFNVH